MNIIDAFASNFGSRGAFSLPRFLRMTVGIGCRPGEGHRWRAATSRGSWQCEDCGETAASEPGPPWTDHLSFLFSPTAQGPNCFWESREACRERQRQNAEREADKAKWRTRQGHDIYMHDEHWACIHLCRSWPDSTPGMEPYYLWVCRRCGEEIRQQIASSFAFGIGQAGPTAYGIQDRFSHSGGLETEGDRALTEKMFHLQSHGVNVEPIFKQQREAQKHIKLWSMNHSCQMFR